MAQTNFTIMEREHLIPPLFPETINNPFPGPPKKARGEKRKRNYNKPPKLERINHRSRNSVLRTGSYKSIGKGSRAERHRFFIGSAAAVSVPLAFDVKQRDMNVYEGARYKKSDLPVAFRETSRVSWPGTVSSHRRRSFRS